MSEEKKSPEENKPAVREQREEEYIPPKDDFAYPVLRDVAGTKAFKKSLDDIILEVQNPGVFTLMGIKPDHSFLFTGPPGTGKTYSFKAIRNELGKRGHKPIELSYDIGRYGTAYINMGARNLQQFFDMGHKYASRGRMILYWFDEADVLMSKRGSSHSHKEDDKLLDCMMKNLQAINSYGTNEFLFFATNFEDAMDPAAIRSGRIDRVIRYEMPTLDALTMAYKMKIRALNGRAREALKENSGATNYNVIRNVDYQQLAAQSQGFNYADIDLVVESGVRRMVRRFLRAKSPIEKPPKVVGNKPFYAVIDDIRDKRQVKRPMGF